ncbi:MAG TPA: DUF1841 family protein [Gammaproteobacteria bacterium]|nr:DUF1841 family protein [Gammaproteobacteria bacterium]
MVSQDQEQLRMQYYRAWEKHRSGEVLEPLESLLADIIVMHPEYHQTIEALGQEEDDSTTATDQHNPFLHMGLHIALLEQVQTNRPDGIAAIYNKLLNKHQNEHLVQHLMIDCLAEALWQGQHSPGGPDENQYKECLEKLQ